MLGSPLFRKYGILMAGLVVSAVLASGAVSMWSAYRESREAQSRVLKQAAESAAERIRWFVTEIATEIGWTTQLPWPAQPIEQRRLDALRLLRQVPAITELRIANPSGREEIAVSRVSPDQVGVGRDISDNSLDQRATMDRVSYGPVYFRSGSEPYMTVAVAGSGGRNGVTLAEVNLKLVWDVIRRIRIGASGHAFVVDHAGRLIADPDISRVLRATDLSRLGQVRGGSPQRQTRKGNLARLRRSSTTPVSACCRPRRRSLNSAGLSLPSSRCGRRTHHSTLLCGGQGC